MSNNNNTWNLNNNDEIPDNLYVSPPGSPISVETLTGRNSFNAKGVNKFKKNFNKRWNNEHPSDPVHVNEYVSLTKKSNNAYANMIAKWKARNTTKNKAYKTRANYNANSQAQLYSQLAQLNPTSYNSSDEHSAQYWQNKRAANVSAQAKAAVKAPPKWATVSTGKLIRTRKNRKSRKSRKSRK